MKVAMQRVWKREKIQAGAVTLISCLCKIVTWLRFKINFSVAGFQVQPHVHSARGYSGCPVCLNSAIMTILGIFKCLVITVKSQKAWWLKYAKIRARPWHQERLMKA